MKNLILWSGLALGISLAFGACDVEDVEGSDWRDEEIAQLEGELDAAHEALAVQGLAALPAQAASQAEDADGAEPLPEDEADMAQPSYACCVKDNSKPPKGVCKKGSAYNTKAKCETTEKGIFFSDAGGQDGYKRCQNECDGKAWTGNLEPFEDAPLE